MMGMDGWPFIYRLMFQLRTCSIPLQIIVIYSFEMGLYHCQGYHDKRSWVLRTYGRKTLVLAGMVVVLLTISFKKFKTRLAWGHWSFTTKEFKADFRNRAILPLIFVVPVVQLLILPPLRITKWRTSIFQLLTGIIQPFRYWFEDYFVRIFQADRYGTCIWRGLRTYGKRWFGFNTWDSLPDLKAKFSPGGEQGFRGGKCHQRCKSKSGVPISWGLYRTITMTWSIWLDTEATVQSIAFRSKWHLPIGLILI